MVTTLINLIDNMIYHWKENFASFPTVYLASFYLPYKRSYSKKCSGGYFQYKLLFVYWKVKATFFVGEILGIQLNLFQYIFIESFEQYTKDSEICESKIQDGGQFDL